MSLCTCPAPDHLRHYAEGRLDPLQHEVIDAHLDSCPGCLRRVEELDDKGHASFPHLMPLPAQATTEGPDFCRLVATVKNLPAGQEAPPPFSALVAALSARGYDLLAPVGAGGMGRVYKAEHRRMKRTVA